MQSSVFVTKKKTVCRTNRVSMEESMGQNLLKIGLNSIAT